MIPAAIWTAGIICAIICWIWEVIADDQEFDD